MHLFFPLSEENEFEVALKSSRNRESVKKKVRRNGNFLDLSGIPSIQMFTLYCSGKALFSTSIEKLIHLERNVKLIRGTTCLDVWMKQERLYPVRSTTCFYINDLQIFMFSELVGVLHDCPLVVTWHHEGVPVYGSLATIPASEDLHQFHRTYATGFFLHPEVSTGRWTVTLHLVTGRELFQQQFQILDCERIIYRQYYENYTKGRVFDERVE